MIELARSEHLKPLVQLCYEYYQISPQREIIEFDSDVCMDFLRRAMIVPTQHLLVYTYGGEAQGGCLAYLSPYAFNTKNRCHLEYLFVRESHRQEHADCTGGRDLVQAVEQWAQAHNVAEISSGDIGFDVDHIQRFFESQGYTYTGACVTKRI